MARATAAADAADLRRGMVDQIRALHANVTADTAVPALDERVLEVMTMLPRHAFVPPEVAGKAYSNAPLAIGAGQTISQPYIVALMSSLARLHDQSRVLEIGTGSGYQTAILAAIAGEVFTIEALAGLAARAAAALRAQATGNITTRIGDGHVGWPEAAPFDAIVVTAAPYRVPPALLEQLAPGGRLVIPYGGSVQMLTVLEKSSDGEITETAIVPVRFVPLLAS